MFTRHTHQFLRLLSHSLRQGFGFFHSLIRVESDAGQCSKWLARLHLVSSAGRLAAITVVSFALLLRATATEVSPEASDLADLSLEALMDIEVATVFGASKVEQKTTEAPSSVTVISADDIKRQGYRTVADVLESAQGFYVSYDRNYAFVGTRGVNLGDFNGRILVLLDGHRVNNNLTDGAYIDTAFILDIDLIDRIEIIRGPGSALYGNNAFLAVVNVITRRGKQLNGAEVSGEYGEYDTYKARVTYGKQFSNGMELLLSATYYDSAGDDKLYYSEFDTPGQNNGVAEDLDDDSFGSFFGSVGYQDFTLEGGYIRREKGNPTAQFFTAFNDSRLRTTDDRGYAALKYAHSFTDVADVSARIYYDRSEFEIDYPYDTSSFKEEDIGEWWGTEVQVNKRLWERHLVTIGAEYRDDFRQERRISGQPTVSEDQQSHGVFAQGDFAVLTNLHLYAGGRYDQYGDFDPAFNPRVALIYNPWKQSTLKAIYGTAFRVPSFLEQTLSQPGELQPEEVSTYELVYEQGIGRHLQSSVSGFYNRMDELIVFQNGGFENLDADTTGVEVALQGAWSSGVRCRASYTFQDVRNVSGGNDLPDSPAHLVKVNVSVPVYKEKIFAGLEFQYTSSRQSLHNTTDINGQPVTVQGANVDGFGIVNFTLFSKELVKNLEFSASIYNLLDCNYSDPATRFHQQDSLEQDGRTYRLKLTYRF